MARSSPRPLSAIVGISLALAAPYVVLSCDLAPLASSSASGATSGSGGATTGSTSSSSTASIAASSSSSSSSAGGGTTASSSAMTGSGTTGSGGLGGAGGTMQLSDAGDAGDSADASNAADAPIEADAQGGLDGGNGADASDAGMSFDASDASDASDAPSFVEFDGSGACGTVSAEFPLQAGIHVQICSPLAWPTNPPTSGKHYPVWAQYKTYTTPVPRGFWVHDLEHGAIVITYNCPNGCAADLAALQIFLDARPADPLCAPPVKFRHVVTPDPLLDTYFAASAWGASLKSSCFDLVALGAFMDAHYGKAPENFCADGTDVTSPDAGYPASCGEPQQDAGADADAAD